MAKLNKFFIFAKNPDNGKKLRSEAEAMGFVYSETEPDFIISFGGDGTFLRAETNWPGVPKLLVRDSLRCMKCHDEPVEEMLAKIKAGKCMVYDIIKLKAIHKGKELTAANDVCIRNSDVRKGIRFTMSIDGKQVDDTIIGDGVVISTPFGSTGYYYSITRKTFDSGIGIAFNNTIKKMDPLVISDDSEIKIDIVREKVDIAVDNNPEVMSGGFGDSIIIKKSDEIGKIVTHTS